LFDHLLDAHHAHAARWRDAFADEVQVLNLHLGQTL
jgi:hypothetical protein